MDATLRIYPNHLKSRAFAKAFFWGAFLTKIREDRQESQNSLKLVGNDMVYDVWGAILSGVVHMRLKSPVLMLVFMLVLILPAAPLMAGEKPGDKSGEEPEGSRSSISSVTVFPNMAQVTRTLAIELEAGDHSITLDHLPLKLLRDSVRVTGEADGELYISSVDVHEITPRVKPLSTGGGSLAEALQKLKEAAAPEDGISDEDRAAIEKLQGKILPLQEEINYLDHKLSSIASRRKLLALMPQKTSQQDCFVENFQDKSTQSDDAKPDKKLICKQKTPDWWVSLLGVMEKADGGLDDAKYKINIRRNQIKREIAKLKKQKVKLEKLARLKAQARARVKPKPKPEPADKPGMSIKVHLFAKTAVRGKLHVQYLIKGAGWTPLYDARLSTGGKGVGPELQIVRNALVSQETGEDWKNVRLKLSTTRTDQRSAAPWISEMTVSYHVGYSNEAYMPPDVARRLAAGKRISGIFTPATKTKLVSHAPVEVETGNYHAQFAIAGAISIDSDGENRKVRIGVAKTKPKLADLVVPEKDVTAYLYAKFNHNKGAATLLPGRVALFRDGMFVGNSALPLIIAGQEHLLGFGPDEAVKVRREIIRRKKAETGFIMKANMEERRFRIFVHNLHQKAIKITVIDRTPHSDNDEIKVTSLPDATKPDRIDIGRQKGVQAWDLRLAADAQKTIEHAYRIDWPSKRRVFYFERVSVKKKKARNAKKKKRGGVDDGMGDKDKIFSFGAAIKF